MENAGEDCGMRGEFGWFIGGLGVGHCLLDFD